MRVPAQQEWGLSQRGRLIYRRGAWQRAANRRAGAGGGSPQLPYAVGTHAERITLIACSSRFELAGQLRARRGRRDGWETRRSLSFDGIVMPSALAVFRLRASSTFVS